jgi:Trk K+ transport system NAD-binding subunit
VTVADSFIVAGSDSLAVRLASELIALGEGVVVIAREIQPRFRVLLEREGVRVLEGDARDVADLRDAGLDEATALAIVEEDDVGNLHAALAAYSVRAEVPLVVRIFNQHLGARLEELFPHARILSASAIAAPAFLAAALRTAQRIMIADRSFEVRPLRDDDDLPGALAVAAFDADAGTATLFPPPAPGVLALVPDVSREDEDDADAGAFETAAEGVRQAASLASSFFTRAAAIGRLVDRRLVAVLALVALLIVAAASVWSASTHYNLIDSAYFAVTTVSTTGYGDITPLHDSDALKFGVMALMLIGALAVAVVYALVTDAIVGVRLARSLGERPRPRRDHVVVLGLGRIGLRVIEGLVARRIPCVAVERNEDAPGVHAARRLRVPVMLTDATRAGVLDALYLDRARCVMVVTNDDAANLEAALNARALRPDLRVVLRLFDHDLAQRVESAFSFHVSRSVSSLAAPAFTAALSGRRALATIPIGAQAVTVAELSAPAGRTVAELERAAKGEARVIALGRRWSPEPDHVVSADEPVVAVGSPQGLAALTRG